MAIDVDSDRLGTRMSRRRRSLGLSASEAARRAGMARNTWMGAEKGTRRTAEYNFASIERALRWAPGSIDAILQGEDPVELDLERDEPAGAVAVVEQIIEILRSRYSPAVKIQMIEDVIERDYQPDVQAEAEPAGDEPARAAVVEGGR